jgi:hypothetical protein
MSIEKTRMQRIAGIRSVGQLNEAIGGYIDLLGLREDERGDIDSANQDAIENMRKELENHLSAEELEWYVDNEESIISKYRKDWLKNMMDPEGWADFLHDWYENRGELGLGEAMSVGSGGDLEGQAFKINLDGPVNKKMQAFMDRYGMHAVKVGGDRFQQFVDFYANDKETLKAFISKFYPGDEDDMQEMFDGIESTSGMSEGMNDDSSGDPFPSISKGSQMYATDDSEDEKGWGNDDNDEDDYIAYNSAEAMFRDAVEMLAGKMDSEAIHDLFMSVLDSQSKTTDPFIQANRDAVGAKGSHQYDESINEKKAPEAPKDEKPEKKYSSTDKRGYMDKLGKGKSNKLTGKAAERPYMGGANAVKKEAKSDRPSSLQESLKPSGELGWKL